MSCAPARPATETGRLARTRWAVANAVILGAAVGLLEATGVMVVAEPSGGMARAVAAWGSSAALAAAGALPLAFLFLMVVAAMGRLRLVCRLWRDLVEGGGPRAVAVWRIALVTVAVVLFAVICFHAAAWTYEKSLDRETRLFAAFIAAASHVHWLRGGFRGGSG